MCALAPEVCMQGVCPCSNPVITRPGPLRQRNGGRAGRRSKVRDGQGPEVEQGVRQQQRSEKDDFQPDDSKGLAAGGFVNRVFASFSVKSKNLD